MVIKSHLEVVPAMAYPTDDADSQLNGHVTDEGEESADSDTDEAFELSNQHSSYQKQVARQTEEQALKAHHEHTIESSSGTLLGRDPNAQHAYVEEHESIIDQARQYQQELFERAKDENVIAVLDTGMGKTLIAVMLIRYTLERDLVSVAEGRPQRCVFFLANR